MNLNKIHTCLFLEKNESYSDSLLLFSKSMEKEDVKLLQYKQKAAGKRWRNIEKQPGLALCYNVFIENVDCRSEGNILGGGTEKKGDDHFCKMDYNTIIKWGITFLRKAGAMSRMTLSEKIAIRQRL